MMRQPRDYFSYLLRIWRSGQGREVSWQASLECPLSGERRRFASLEELWAFLKAQIGIEGDETENHTQKAEDE